MLENIVNMQQLILVLHACKRNLKIIVRVIKKLYGSLLTKAIISYSGHSWEDEWSCYVWTGEYIMCRDHAVLFYAFVQNFILQVKSMVGISFGPQEILMVSESMITYMHMIVGQYRP